MVMCVLVCMLVPMSPVNKTNLFSISVLMGMGQNHGYKIINLF